MITDEDLAMHLASTVDDGFALNPPGFEWLSQWTHVLLHLTHARAHFEALLGEPSSGSKISSVVVDHGRFVAAIVAYGRCYAQSGAGIPTLDAKQVHAGSEDALATHRRLTELRNKFAAHADHIDLIHLTLAVREEPDLMVIRHIATIALPLNEIVGFVAAVDRTEQFVTTSLNKHLDHLQTKFGKVIVLD